MANGIYRIGIVGASSLAGKELAEQINESQLAASDVLLLDDEESAGQIAAAGEEAAIIQPIEESSFDRLDFVFFTGNADTTKKYWKAAQDAGASIVDMTSALDKKADVLVRAPWIDAQVPSTERSIPEPDLKTSAVVSAHPAAVMLAMVAHRLKKLRLKSLAATVMEPASEHGKEAMDELHQQTVSLLSFQSLPREQYDAQVAFNLLPSLGQSAKIDLEKVKGQIADHLSTLIGGEVSTTIQLIQAPVFHGYVISALVDLAGPAPADEIQKALEGERIELVEGVGESASNVSAATQENIMVTVQPVLDRNGETSRIWLWLAGDNLKLAAMNAIACASELRRLRPRGKIQ